MKIALLVLAACLTSCAAIGVPVEGEHLDLRFATPPESLACGRVTLPFVLVNHGVDTRIQRWYPSDGPPNVTLAMRSCIDGREFVCAIDYNRSVVSWKPLDLSKDEAFSFTARFLVDVPAGRYVLVAKLGERPHVSTSEVEVQVSGGEELPDQRK